MNLPTATRRAKEAWKCLHLCSPRTLRTFADELRSNQCGGCSGLPPQNRCDACFAHYQVAELVASIAAFGEAGDTDKHAIPTEEA